MAVKKKKEKEIVVESGDRQPFSTFLLYWSLLYVQIYMVFMERGQQKCVTIQINRMPSCVFFSFFLVHPPRLPR